MKIEKNNFLKTKKAQDVFEKKIKPLFGNNRSFSCAATRRQWKNNKQQVTMGNEKYVITARAFRTISKQLKALQSED